LPDPVARLAAALAEIAGAPVELERPGDPAHGDYATNVALRVAPSRGRAPLELAEEIAAAALERGLVGTAETAGAGFVNLRVSDGWISESLAGVLDAGAAFGGGSAVTPERIQVEMVSANPTGPLTVGSARNGAFGDSVARLLELAGHNVEREYYYNDAGTQIERFRESVEAIREGRDPPDDGYRGEYVRELAARQGDPVQAMLERIEKALERFRVHFDTWERESEFGAEVDDALPLLDTYEAEGAVWARTSAHGDDQDRVLVRSNGSPTYFGKDAAYIRRKLSGGFDRLVYVLGADHHGYVARLQALAEMLGHRRDAVEVLIYQLVNLVERGEARKMSKRRGDVVFLDELLDAIGVDAARWYLVSRGHDQAIEIDVDLAAERTQKNPVYYVQYAHARTAGILRNALGQVPFVAPVEAQRTGPEPLLLALEERELVKRLLEFPQVARDAAERRAPHAIPNYSIRVADDFHRFYHHHRVLGSEEERFRLTLCAATQQIVARCLDLIGVEAPERM
jgi:arginyl-tRNA synthetase